MPITLTAEQRKTAEEMVNVLGKALEVITPPLPSFNNLDLYLRVYDAYVAPGERVARIPVVLDQPAKQTMVVKYLTSNDTAIEGSHFVRAEGYLLFQPGEQFKVVLVTLKQDLGSKKFKLTVGWPQNDKPLKIATGYSSANISGDTFLLLKLYPDPVLPKPAALMQRPANLDLVFSDSFGAASFVATDSGYLADGTSVCWKTKLHHGRTQATNKELGYYADAAINPGTNPLIRVDGKLNLQAEYFPNGVGDIDGVPIPCPWDVVNNVQQPFRYTASVLTTQTLFPTIRRGTYVEGKLTMPLVQGSWPALWLIAADLSWPSIELDLFEGFFNAAGNLAQVGTTVHWKNADGGGHAMFSSKLPFLNVDLTQPQVWGMYWGDDAVTFYCNDIPYMAVPNVFPDKDCYLKIDIAVGGLVTKPANPATTFPVRMPIDWVKIWQ